MSNPQQTVSIELFAYPWDIVDRGVAEFAAECRDLGVTRLHVTALYHSGKFLLPRNRTRKVYFPEAGAVYVPLDGTKLGTMTPARSPLADSGWLEELTASGMPLSAWTVFHHNSRLAALHPSLTVRNVFGDPYPFALCPSHEAVRNYSMALATEVCRTGYFQSLDLETIGYLGYFHGYHHEVTAGPAGPLENFLLSLCFCEACEAGAKTAGVDMGALAAHVREILQRKWRADDSAGDNPENMEQVAALLAQLPELHELVRIRLNTVTRLVQDIVAAVSPAKVSVFTSSFVGAPSNIWMEGVSMSRLSAHVDSFNLLAYTPDTGAVNGDLLFCLSQVQDPARLNLTLNLGLPVTPTFQAAAAKVTFALKQGVRRFSFFNYGFLGEGRLGWIRQLADLC